MSWLQRLFGGEEEEQQAATKPAEAAPRQPQPMPPEEAERLLEQDPSLAPQFLKTYGYMPSDKRRAEGRDPAAPVKPSPPVRANDPAPRQDARLSGDPLERPEVPADSALGRIGEVAGGTLKGQFKTQVSGLAESVAEQALRTVPGMDEQTRQEILDDTLDSARDYGDEGQQQASEALEAASNNAERYVGQALGTIGVMGPSLAIGYITRNPNLAAGVFGTQAGASKYNESRRKGRTHEQALLDGTVVGGIETVTERIPLGILTREGGSAFQRIWKGAAAEGVQEPVATGLEIAYDAGILKDEEWFDEDGQFKTGDAVSHLIDAGIIGTLAGGGMGVTVASVDQARQKWQQYDEQRKTGKATDVLGQFSDADLNAIPEYRQARESGLNHRQAVEQMAQDPLLRQAALEGSETLLADEDAANQTEMVLAQMEEEQLTQLPAYFFARAEQDMSHEAALRHAARNPTVQKAVLKHVGQTDLSDVAVRIREQGEVSPLEASQAVREGLAKWYGDNLVLLPPGKRLAAQTLEQRAAMPETQELGPGAATSAEMQQPIRVDVDTAASEAATSPTNNLPEPTEAQKEAGNYKKGHVQLHGLDLSIENPRGSKRRPEWPDLTHHYGYIRRTEAADGEQLDVFVGPEADRPDRPVYVVDQINPDTGEFDEHKVLMGFDSVEAAEQGYRSNYDKTWKGLGKLTRFPNVEAFKAWMRDADLTQESAATSAGYGAQSAVVDVAAAGQADASVKPKRSKDKVQPEHDSLLEALSKLTNRDGQRGLSRSEAEAQGIDPAAFKSAGYGIQRAFTQNGMSFDEAAEALSELGYPVTNEQGDYDPNVLLERLSDELAGKPVRSTSRQEAEFERQYEERRQAEAEQEKAELDLLGDDTRSQQAMADEARRRDAKRNSGQDELETGDPSDMFSQARQQTDLTDFTERRENTAERARIDALPADEQQAEIERLRRENKELQRKLDTDPLTLLHSRARYDRDLPKAGGVVQIDLTLFKGYNTLLTDAGGDRVLQEFAIAMDEVAPDMAYRRGGDEFAFLTATEEEAHALLEQLHAVTGALRFELTDKDGNPVVVEGIPFTGGVGTNEAEAIAARDATKVEGDRNALPANIRQLGQAESEAGSVRREESDADEVGVEELYAGYEREASTLRERDVSEPAADDRAGQGDLFAPANLAKASAQDQARDTFHVRYQQVETGEINIGLDRVTSAEDAAHVIAPIRKYGQETFVALVTDADGKTLNLIRHSIGVKDGATVDPLLVAGAIASTEGAAQVWFGHNHPSGKTDPSTADQVITGKLLDSLDGLGVDVRGHIIVGPGDKPTYFMTSQSGRSEGQVRIEPTAAPRRKRVALTERVIRRRQINERDQIRGPQDAERVVRELGTDNGVLLLNNQHHPVGVVSMSPAEMKTLRAGGRVQRMLRALDTTNASAGIIISTEPAAAANMARFLNRFNGNFRVLDAFVNGQSSQARGGDAHAHADTGPFFSKGQHQTDTPAFKKWFGDSKVVDENGDPLVVYHGGGDSLSAFDNMRGAIFFTPDAKAAADFADSAATNLRDGDGYNDAIWGAMESAGDTIYPVYLSVQNPFDSRNKEHVETVAAAVSKDTRRKIDLVRQDLATGNYELLEDHFEAIKKAGFDGFYEKESPSQDYWNIGVFRPEQIKSAIGNRGTFDPADPDIRFAKDAPSFYSALTRAAENLKQQKGTAQQMLAAIRNQHGVKAEELAWTGLEEYLRLKGSESVTRDEIVDYLQGNGVQVRTVILSGDRAAAQEAADRLRDAGFDLEDDGTGIRLEEEGREVPRSELTDEQRADYDTIQSGGAAKYGKYTLPGGSNYREVLLTLPSSRGTTDEYAQLIYGKNYDDLSPNEQGNVNRRRSSTRDQEFKTSHFDEPNILAHVRLKDFTDANGDKVLLVEEMQSDWHQAGRKKGYARKDEFDELTAKVRKAANNKLVGDTGAWTSHVMLNAGVPYELMNSWFAAVNAQEYGVPNAPFKGNAWVELAAKRVLQLAVEGGYDRVAWMPGEVQADRYDLSKQINMASAIANGDGTYNLIVEDKNGNEVDPYSRSGKKVTPDEMEDTIGKELTQKLIEGADRNKGKPWPKNVSVNPEFFTLRGLELKVGGHGMRGFYDRTLPNIVKKITRKLDKVAKIEPTAINADVGKPTDYANFDAYKAAKSKPAVEALSISITDAMREAINAGLPLFKRGKGQADNPKTERTRNLVNNLANQFAARPTVQTVDDWTDLPSALKQYIRDEADGRNTKGLYVTGNNPTIYIVAGNMVNERDATETLIHEMIGHHGVRTVLGETEFYEMMDAVAAAFPADIRIAIRRNGLDQMNLPTEQVKRIAAEEVIAYAAQDIIAGKTTLKNLPQKLRFWFERLIAAIRRMFRLADPAFNSEVTEDDIIRLIARSYDFVRSGRAARMARAGYQLRSVNVPPFYSQLVKTINAKLPERAPPAEFLKQIRGQLGKDGLKPEEFKWSGLEEALSDMRIAHLSEQDRPLESKQAWEALPEKARREIAMSMWNYRPGMTHSEFASEVLPDSFVTEMQRENVWPDIVTWLKTLNAPVQKLSKAQLVDLVDRNLPRIEPTESYQAPGIEMGDEDELQDSIDDAMRADGNYFDASDGEKPDLDDGDIYEAREGLWEDEIVDLLETDDRNASLLDHREEVADWLAKNNIELGDDVEIDSGDEVLAALGEARYSEMVRAIAPALAADEEFVTENILNDSHYEMGYEAMPWQVKLNDYTVHWHTFDDYTVVRNSDGQAFDSSDPNEFIAEDMDYRQRVTQEQRGTKWSDYITPGNEANYREWLYLWDNNPGQAFTYSSHWDDVPNVLLHVRGDHGRTTPDGATLQYIDELQSDWHQQARERGFIATEADKQAAIAKVREQTKAFFETHQKRFPKLTEVAQALKAEYERVFSGLDTDFGKGVAAMMALRDAFAMYNREASPEERAAAFDRYANYLRTLREIDPSIAMRVQIATESLAGVNAEAPVQILNEVINSFAQTDAEVFSTWVREQAGTVRSSPKEVALYIDGAENVGFSDNQAADHWRRVSDGVAHSDAGARAQTQGSYVPLFGAIVNSAGVHTDLRAYLTTPEHLAADIISSGGRTRVPNTNTMNHAIDMAAMKKTLDVIIDNGKRAGLLPDDYQVERDLSTMESDVPPDGEGNITVPQHALDLGEAIDNYTQVQSGGIPFAPMAQSYPLVALKHQLQLAVQNGMDEIAFANGERHAMRWGALSEYDALHLHVGDDGKLVDPAIDYRIDPDNLGRTFPQVEVQKAIKASLSLGETEIIIKADHVDVGRIWAARNDMGRGLLEAYNSVMPKTFNKFLKKYGMRFELGEMKAGPGDLLAAAVPNRNVFVVVNDTSGLIERAGPFDTRAQAEADPLSKKKGSYISVQTTARMLVPVWRAKITDKAREAARTTGFPLFQKTQPQTDTAAFKRWFGDSKVVDENGDPLVVYHGTDALFSEFDPDSAGRVTDTSDAREGFWFTASRDRAADAAQDAMNVSGNNVPYVMDVYLSIQNPKIVNRSLRDFEPSESARKIRKARKAGHDGVIFSNGESGAADYVVFRPEQIKSAIGNHGTFDPRSPNILFAKGAKEVEIVEGFRKKRQGTVRKSLPALVKEWTQDWKARLNQAIFDDLYSIKRAEMEIGQIPKARTGYVSGRLAKGADEVLRTTLELGAPVWDSEDVAARAPSFDRNSKAFFEILAPLRDADLLELFKDYLVAYRAQRLLKEDRERLFSQEEIDTILERSKEFPLLEEVRKEYAALNKAVLDFAEAAGVINKATRTLWENEDYVPFYRVADEAGKGKVIGPFTGAGKLANLRNMIKALRGSDKNMGDPIDNIILNWSTLIRGALNNHAAALAIDNLNGTGLVTKPQQIEFRKVVVPRSDVKRRLEAEGVHMSEMALDGFMELFAMEPPKGDNVLHIFRDGKREYWDIHDPLLFRSLTAIGKQPFGPWMNVFRIPKRVLTQMITLSPEFQLRNWFRDALSSFVLRRDTKAKPLYDGVKGVIKTTRRDADFSDMMSTGATFESGYVNSHDPGAVQRVIRGRLRSKNFKNSIIDKPLKLFELYRDLSSGMENANRIPIYTQTLKDSGNRKLAAYEAKDIMDFSMRGDAAVIRFLTESVAFFNARLQGLYRIPRAWSEADPRDKSKIAAAVAIRGMLLMLPTLYLYLRNRHLKCYKDLPAYDKDLYYHFFIGDESQGCETMRHYRLPKPFEMGAVFSTIPERALEAMLSEEPDKGETFARRLAWVFGDMLNLNPIPTTMEPWVELLLNRDTFRDAPILNAQDQELLPEIQYDHRTPPTFRYLTQYMAEAPGAPDWLKSPKQLEHIVSAYIGTLGNDYAMLATDAVVRAAEDYPAPPAKRLDEIPFVKSFVREHPLKYTTHMDTLYSVYEEVSKYARTLKELEKRAALMGATGNDALTERLEKQIDWLVRTREPELIAADEFRATIRHVSGINEEIMLITLDAEMSPEEKRQRIDELYRERNEVIEEVIPLRPGGPENPRREEQDDISKIIGDTKTRKQQVDALEAAGLPQMASLVDALPTRPSTALQQAYRKVLDEA